MDFLQLAGIVLVALVQSSEAAGMYIVCISYATWS